jgi:phosphate starvation-inducible membrane PsiE
MHIARQKLTSLMSDDIVLLQIYIDLLGLITAFSRAHKWHLPLVPAY